MKKYSGLLESIARDLNIPKGNEESDLDCKCRIIYSILGQMANASLYDVVEDGQPISITHVKRRVLNTYQTYQALYPEIRWLFFPENELVDAIYKIMCDTGQFYHSPNRVSPALSRTASCGGIQLIRGISALPVQFSCGLGNYAISPTPMGDTNDIYNMFGIDSAALKDLWQSTLSRSVWAKAEQKLKREYLRTTPPFNKGYWSDQPITFGASICRTEIPDGHLYSLYKVDNHIMWTCQLPAFLGENGAYRQLSNSHLYALGSLPPTEYHVDGKIVHINMQYLMPPAEQNLIRLYSWPKSFTYVLSDFNRVLTSDVFFALKSSFELIGYQFIEV